MSNNPFETEAQPSNTTSDPAELTKTLERIRQGKDGVELYFDPRAGQLVTRRRGEPLEDQLRPATELAQEGFFGVVAEG